jgi:uncharacterized protein (DUF2147 family)
MRIIVPTLALALGLSASAIGAAAPAADAIVGTWLAPGKTSSAHVRIAREGDQYIGTIVWLQDTVYRTGDRMAGQPVVDRENPDPARRTRSLMGIRLMDGFTFDGEGWSGGHIYDPESGKTYKCKASLEPGGKSMRVRGYVGVSMFGRTSVWTRLE